MKFKLLAVLLCLAMLLTVALPGTWAVSAGSSSGGAVVSVETAPIDGTQESTEAPADPSEETTVSTQPEETQPAESTEPVDPTETTVDSQPEDETLTTDPVCTCGTENEVHAEGCPLYVRELTAYERLIATTTAAEFDDIVAQYTPEELVFTCEEFDALDAHYIYLTTGAYPSHEPIVDEVSTTVNFTNVAPLVDFGN